MTLHAGVRLGPYEIQSPLGAGGMGEVYRARDSRLGREVAIKVLPEAVLADAERVARFEREAKLIAALNHPHIAGVYGLEEVDGRRLLAMELVEGESLAERLHGGPLAVDEAVGIARQIGQALAAAHDKGIIHRDLKPANVMLAADGRVKVLDFGLAKIVDRESTAASASMSPTLTVQATVAGAILGTAAYMSPEQARGRPVDKRTDIWSFGCVLFEMLTARRPFNGDDVMETIAAVVRAEPDYAALPRDVPPHLTSIIRRCLAKDPNQRFADISIPLFLFDDRPATSAPAAAAVRHGGWLARAGWITAAVALGGLATALALWRPWTSEEPPQPMRFAIVLPQAAPLLASVTDRQLDVSPDGRRIAYVSGAPTLGRLMVRELDQIEPHRLTDFSNVRSPFFSPDGKWVAFFAGTDLMKVAITGGPPVTLGQLTTNTRGGTWTADGTIIIATSDRKTGLLILPDAGGEAKPLTSLPDSLTDHLFPSALPDGRGVLYSVRVNDAEASIAVRDRATGVSKVLIPAGDHAQYVESGHVVYASAGTLYAVPFDLGRLEVTGDPVSVVANVATRGTGATDFAVSRTGTLVYAPGGVDAEAPRSLVWVDRRGGETPLPAPPRSYFALRLSPDGRRVAVDIRDQERDIWVWDTQLQTLSRLTFGRGLETFPVWAPDGRTIVYSRASGAGIFMRAADGSGQEQTLGKEGYTQFAQSFTPDGKRLLVTQQRSTNDLVLLDLGAAGETLVVDSPFVDGPGDISPDGRWLAYQSNESGFDQVYVRSLDTQTGGRVQVSPAGGSKPVWSRSQRELFYLDAEGALTSVPVSTVGSFAAGTPMKISSARYFSANQARSYDVVPDGSRFLFIKGVAATQNPATTPASLIVTLNWFEEIRAKSQP